MIFSENRSPLCANAAFGSGSCSVSKLVNRAGIAAEDFLPFGLRQRRLERKTRIVEIPMRVVRREQQAVGADPIDQRAQMFCLIRLVNRLRREPKVLLHIFRRTALE